MAVVRGERKILVPGIPLTRRSAIAATRQKEKQKKGKRKHVLGLLSKRS